MIVSLSYNSHVLLEPIKHIRNDKGTRWVSTLFSFSDRRMIYHVILNSNQPVCYWGAIHLKSLTINLTCFPMKIRYTKLPISGIVEPEDK